MGVKSCAWLGRGAPGPHQQTLGTDRPVLCKILKREGASLRPGELWALEAANAESLLEIVQEASATSGSCHRVDGGGGGWGGYVWDADPQVFLEGCGRLSMHIIRVQAESKPD